MLDAENGPVLIDAGMAGDADRIANQIRRAGYDPAGMGPIVLTHAHGDHIGGVARLVRLSGADVRAHVLEVGYVEGTRRMPVSSPLRRVARLIGDRVSGKSRTIHVTKALEDSEILDVLGGLRVIHTPGHTPGSICLFSDRESALFCGDLLFNGSLLTGRGGLRLPPRLFSVDMEQVRDSLRKLLALEVKVLCVGHGEPIVRPNGIAMAEWLENVLP
jgi:glyoxylase-like metal-dependent hydrolase (beta-lactamase superfamily II)